MITDSNRAYFVKMLGRGLQEGILGGWMKGEEIGPWKKYGQVYL
jgi:hypothetical protein